MSSEAHVASVRVDALGKRYRIARTRTRHNTLRDQLADSLRSAWALAGRTLARRGRREDSPEIWALRDVSFEVAPGEAVGIIGGNGAGKSTLLKVLSQVTAPTEGAAFVRGRTGSLLEVGAGFHSELTGRENIFLNGAVLGMKRAEILRKFSEIVDFAGVERFIDTPVKFYSSGMYLRLAFSVAAHLEPDILIVDEVLAVGDHDFQRRCLARMHDLTTDFGRTVLVVSHDMRAIQRLCDRCILLEQGRIERIGATDRVVADYMARGSGYTAAGRWVDLAAVRRTGTGEARFAGALYGRGDGRGGGLATDAPAEFLLRIDAERAARVASLAVTLSKPGGDVLLNLEMAALGQALTLAPGRNEVGVLVDGLHLNPGVYDVGFWLGDETHRALDHVEGAFRVEVASDGGVAGPRVDMARDGLVSATYTVELRERGAGGGHAADASEDGP